MEFLLKKWVILLLLVVIIDFVYLWLTSGPFMEMINVIQGKGSKIKIMGAVFCYLAIVIMIGMFGLDRKWWEVWLLGATTYTVYDSTNYALFEKWNKLIAIQDVLWGGTLFVIVTQLYNRVIKYI